MNNKAETTAMNVDGIHPLVPKLRFPEFRETQGWEPTTIGALGRFYYGKSAPKWSLSEDAPTPCVRYGELYTKFGSVINETYSRTNTAPETLRFSKGGEILIPRVGEKPEDFGKCCAYLPLKDIAIGEMISVLETKQHPLFYTYYFRNLYKQFAKVVEGQNVKNLYFTELEPLPIYRPSIPEQQNIAECLSSVDELIAAQARKLDALKTHKKGLMQQLFPREGETQPRLRFPEFQDAGEWAEEKLDDIFHLQDGFSFKSTDFVKSIEDATQVVRITDINNKNTNGDKVYIPNAFLEANNLKKYFVENGDLLLSLTGAAGFNFFFWDGGRAVINQRTSKVTPKKKLSSAIARLLEPLVHERINVRGEGQNNNLSKEFLSSVILLIPEPDEQQRIADCLTCLDDLIAAQTQKLEALKTHKKGLMQQLFPSIEEVEA
jgi:type I restriction enzyme S subunit